jgi:hypothetical protein
MKLKNLPPVLIGIILIVQGLFNDYIIYSGLGLYLIIIIIFQGKKYFNNKIRVAFSTLILAISLILTYFQVSSPSYSGNPLIACGLAILFLLIIIIDSYDITHDYRISKSLQMNNVSQKNKDIIAIGLLIAGIW